MGEQAFAELEHGNEVAHARATKQRRVRICGLHMGYGCC